MGAARGMALGASFSGFGAREHAPITNNTSQPQPDLAMVSEPSRDGRDFEAQGGSQGLPVSQSKWLSFALSRETSIAPSAVGTRLQRRLDRSGLGRHAPKVVPRELELSN